MPDDDTDSASAILAAAARLFAEQSPSSVSLRQIAREAGVNYGLIHHYFGTKDAIVAAVFRQASDRGAERIAPATDLDTALRTLLAPRAGRRGPYAQMLSWTLLDGSDQQARFQRSPAMVRIQQLLEAEWAAPDDGSATTREFDPQLVVAVLVQVLSTWPMFEPFLTAAAGLGDRDPDDMQDELFALMATLARAARPASPPLD